METFGTSGVRGARAHVGGGLGGGAVDCAQFLDLDQLLDQLGAAIRDVGQRHDGCNDPVSLGLPLEVFRALIVSSKFQRIGIAVCA